jgi:hypothetical protein
VRGVLSEWVRHDEGTRWVGSLGIVRQVYAMHKT